MTGDEFVIEDIVRDERAGLARVTAYRHDVGRLTVTLMLSLVDGSALNAVIRAALDRKRRDIEALSHKE